MSELSCSLSSCFRSVCKRKLPFLLFIDIPILVAYENYYKKDLVSSLKFVRKDMVGSQINCPAERVLLIDISLLTAMFQELPATN